MSKLSAARDEYQTTQRLLHPVLFVAGWLPPLSPNEAALIEDIASGMLDTLGHASAVQGTGQP